MQLGGAAIYHGQLEARPPLGNGPAPGAGELARADAHACNCTAAQIAQGTVWGPDVYTDDSSICRAARHAGVVPAGGGPVRVQTVPARQSYPASTRNGVTTQQFGPWAGAKPLLHELV